MLNRRFFAREAEVVARDLIGCVLVHRVDGKELRGRVVETEAYVGEHDLACHASKGRTGRTELLFGAAGHAYVYFIYGMHDMLNVVTGKTGVAQAVLIRAAEPLRGWPEGVSPRHLSGPGKLAKGFGITRAENGIDLTGTADDGADEARLYFERGSKKGRIERSVRVGVDYAGEWKDALLRFYDAESAAVSGRPRGASGTGKSPAAKRGARE